MSANNCLVVKQFGDRWYSWNEIAESSIDDLQVNGSYIRCLKTSEAGRSGYSRNTVSTAITEYGIVEDRLPKDRTPIIVVDDTVEQVDASSKDGTVDVARVTRFEVIGENGRLCSTTRESPMKVQFSFQDNGRTLKVFLVEKDPTGVEQKFDLEPPPEDAHDWFF